MNVSVFFNSADTGSITSAQIVKSKYPAATFLDTAGLDESGIDTLVTSIGDGTQSKIFVLSDVGTNPPDGNLIAGQVTTLDDDKFDGLPGSDTAAIVIPAQTASVPQNQIAYRPYLTWQNIYPGETPAFVTSIIGRKNFWLWLASGTASAGVASSITDAASTFPVDALAGRYVEIVAGTGIGQIREITTNSATVLTVSPEWVVEPDNTSEYIVRGYKLEEKIAVPSATATSGGNTTITRTGAGYTTNALRGKSVRILSGTGAGQERLIVSNTATAITVVIDWDVNPNNTSVFNVVEYQFEGTQGKVLEPTQKATAGANFTISNTALNVGWVVNAFAGKAVVITGGTGAGQTRIIASNTGTVLTVHQQWAVNPNNTSIFQIVDLFSEWPYEMADVYLPYAISTSLSNIANGAQSNQFLALFGKQTQATRLQSGGGQDLRLLQYFIEEGKVIYNYLQTL